MIPAPFTLALIIDGSALAVAALVRAALRDRRPAPQGRAPGAVPSDGPGGDPEAAGLAAVIAGVVTGAGITAGLWTCGQARIAGQSLFLALAVVIVAGAAYAAGLRDHRAPAAAGPNSDLQPLQEQDTADLGAHLLALMYRQPATPEPRQPRHGGWDGGPWPPPGPG